jgi:hypothetical protein
MSLSLPCLAFPLLSISYLRSNVGLCGTDQTNCEVKLGTVRVYHCPATVDVSSPCPRLEIHLARSTSVSHSQLNFRKSTRREVKIYSSILTYFSTFLLLLSLLCGVTVTVGRSQKPRGLRHELSLLARSDAGIVGSNPTQSMDIWCARIYAVSVSSV